MKAVFTFSAALLLAACGAQTTDSPITSGVGPEGPVITDFIPPDIPPAPKSLTLEDIKFDSYSEDLAKFIGLETGEQSWSAIDKMRLYFAPEDGTTILSTKTSTFDRPDGSVMVYTVSGLSLIHI